MDSSGNLQLKANALEIINNYRVPDLQALLEYARLPRQGNKRELLQRCKLLISASLTSQLVNKINQINIARINSTRSHGSSLLPSLRISLPHSQPIALPPAPSIETLPLPNQIPFVSLPFFDRLRTFESINIPVNWSTFSPLRFILTDFDVDLLIKGTARILLRIVPTITSEKQNDVLPPYLFLQCNSQIVINNNASKTVGSQAHSIAFPVDITERILPKSNVHNTLTYHWLQSPTKMSLKNLPKSYTLAIQLVRCMPLDSLIENIVKRECPVINADENDSDIEIEDVGLMATRHRVSLICPITQSLIRIPTKSSCCSHLTCFDLRSFLQMNQRRLQWTCPLCKKSAAYDQLRVDKRLQSILANVPANCSTVEMNSSTKLLSDCQYILDNLKQEKNEPRSSTSSHEIDDDEEEEGEISVINSPIKSRRQSSASDCIVLSSGSESEDENDSPLPTSSLSTDFSHPNKNVEDARPTFNTSQSPLSIHSLESFVGSYVDDGSYWEDVARMTSNLITDDNNHQQERNCNRKRSNSSLSGSGDDDDDSQHRKRTKRTANDTARTGDIELLVLSSSDSDNHFS